MPKPNRQTAREAQEGEEISVDLNEADPNKAVQRRERPRSDLAASANERDEDGNGRVSDWADRSKEVNKRIGRVTRSFEQKMAEQQAEFQRQLSEERARVDKLLLERGGGAGNADAAHEAKVKEVTAKLEAAIEQGNSAEQAKLTAELTRLENQYWAKKAADAGVAQRETHTNGATTAATRTAKPGGPTAAGSRFILANEGWWSDPEFEIEKTAAGTIYARLVRKVEEGGEGMDANDDETFAAVAAELRRKFPDLDVATAGKKRRAVAADEDEDLDREISTRRAASGAIQDRGQGGATRSMRRTLTAKEIETMRKADLDPANNAHVLAFLREDQAYAAQEGR